MPSPIDPLMPYLNTFIFFAAYTVLYKNNPVYRFAQSLIVGVSAGYLIVANVNNFYNNAVTLMIKQGPTTTTVLAWIIGVCFVFVFFPRLINIYRGAAILVMTVGIGMQLPYGPALFWSLTQGYAKNAFNIATQGVTYASVGALGAAIAFGLGLSYFFFTDRVDKPTAIFRRGGRIVLLIYAALCIVLTALGMVNQVQWKTLDSINGVPPTWFIPIGLFLLCVIDAFVFPLRRLVSRAPVAEAKTTTS